MEGSVTWVALAAALNLGINSLTLLLVIAQNLRMSTFLFDISSRPGMEDRSDGRRNPQE